MDGSARLVQIAAGLLHIVRILQIIPLPLGGVEVDDTGMKVRGQARARCELAVQHPHAVLPIQEQRNDGRAWRSAWQLHTVFDVDGQQAILMGDCVRLCHEGS